MMKWILSMIGAVLLGTLAGCKTGAPEAATAGTAGTPVRPKVVPELDRHVLEMAEAGDLEAQYRVGVYEQERGAYQRAAAWYAKAAAVGHAGAQDRLGFLYATGQGVAQDNAVAFGWFQKSAAQNYPPAISNLGLMYLRGRGVPVDEQKAIQLFIRAAEAGDSRSQARLGGFFERGEHVVKNPARAYDWYRKAAAQNDPQGQNGLAWLMATSPVDALRNGAAAVHYATLANEQTRWQNTQYLATLAAAYAERGDFQEAVRWQSKVTGVITGFSEAAAAKMRSRLQLFNRGQPYRSE